jgi:2TM domain-containing protein
LSYTRLRDKFYRHWRAGAALGAVEAQLVAIRQVRPAAVRNLGRRDSQPGDIMEDLRDDLRYQEARRHVHQLRGFYTHALVYVLVNAGLFAFHLAAGPGWIWFGWATFGWGIGLLAHAVSVFAFGGWLGPRWEERKIREYLDRRA